MVNKVCTDRLRSSYGRMATRAFHSASGSNRREFFSGPQVCGAAHCSLLYVTLSRLANHSVAVAVTRAGYYRLREAPAAALAALHA